MAIELLRKDCVTLDAGLLEELVTSTETPVSDAPPPTPEGLGSVRPTLLTLLLSPKEPKEPRRR
ncbi:hypothetical protein [Streptomyces coeruleofuscus]|uniref:Uncharacterized protein n=1 Tax=Streptomyces coeruleofuscus TaxID=66879 RepID=A0ABN3HRQ7_9ACTN